MFSAKRGFTKHWVRGAGRRDWCRTGSWQQSPETDGTFKRTCKKQECLAKGEKLEGKLEGRISCNTSFPRRKYTISIVITCTVMPCYLGVGLLQCLCASYCTKGSATKTGHHTSAWWSAPTNWKQSALSLRDYSADGLEDRRGWDQATSNEEMKLCFLFTIDPCEEEEQ